MIYDNEMKDRVEQLKSQLHTLAQAVLDGHKISCYFCPLKGTGCKHITHRYCCQCEACTLAREVLK